MTQRAGQSPWKTIWRRRPAALGPLLVLVAGLCALTQTNNASVFTLLFPTVFVVLVASSLISGLAYGLVGAAIALAFRVLLLVPGHPFGPFTHEHGDMIAAVAVNAPLTALAIGLLRQRLSAAVERHARESRLTEQLKTEVERHQATQAVLAARETHLRLVTDLLPAAVLYVDRSVRFRMVNATYASWRGRTKEDIIGREVRELAGEELHARSKDMIESAAAGRTVAFDTQAQYADKLRSINITSVPDQDDGGDLRGLILLISDITDQKVLETELRRAKEEAEAASRAKSAFLANMSHEIRTPLGAVLGFSEMLLENSLPPPERASCVAVIKRNGEMLSNLINDILDMSRVEAGQLRVAPKDTRVRELLTETQALLKFRADERGIGLNIHAAADLPDVVRTDPLRLRQILMNVAGNAIKFTDQGSVTITCTYDDEHPRGPRLTFAIADTGPGIRPEDHARIFEVFTQGDASSTRRHGGSGLGLPLARDLARRLGGDVELASSEWGRGTTFTVWVSAPSRASRTRPRDALEQDPGKSLALSGFRLLLAEDAPDNQILFSRMLRLDGAEVEVVGNGADAVKRAQEEAFDVLLMDLQMPEMDGYEATALLRRGGYTKPILALTAHALSEERQRCLARGFDDHLSKPVNRASLIGCLKRLHPDGSARG